MNKSQWQRTMDVCAAAQREMMLLGKSGEDVPVLVKQALAEGNLQVYWLLPRVDDWRRGLTLSVANELLDRALLDRTAGFVCRTLGAMRFSDLERVIGPLVIDRLHDPDSPYADLDYRRYAELLEYLGLRTALRTLVLRALASCNPEVRAVGVEFGPGRETGVGPLASRVGRPTPHL